MSTLAKSALILSLALICLLLLRHPAKVNAAVALQAANIKPASKTQAALGTQAAPITWAHDIAPIIYKNCTTCHHTGGAGPFNLLTYGDAKRWAPQILRVTQSRFMPPWLPEPGYGNFADVRRLSDGE